MPFEEKDPNNDLLINALWVINHLLEEGDREMTIIFYEKNLLFVLTEIFMKYENLNKIVEMATWVSSIFLKSLVKITKLEESTN